jgi:hypothetical protein
MPSAADVSQVITIGRAALEIDSPKLKKIVLPDRRRRVEPRSQHGYLAAACGDEPAAHLRELLAAVFEGPFAKPLTADIGKPAREAQT